MAIKYRIEYRNYFDQLCRVDIANETYTGAIINLRGVGGQATTLVRNCGDDPFETIINSTLNVNFYQPEEMTVDILELQLAGDRDFTVQLFVNNELKFKGFLVADGIQNDFAPAPYEINISAVDGLSLLDGLPYNIDSGIGMDRSLINYVKQILLHPLNLGNALPIDWVNTLKNDNYPSDTDIMTGSLRFANSGEGLYDINEANGAKTFKSCRYILEGILKSMQCRIFQNNGKWVIARINSIVNGQFFINSMTNVLADNTVTTALADIRTYIGNGGKYNFIENDVVITVLPALKSVTTEYKQNERKNILPNGGMDITQVVMGFDVPIHWQGTGGVIVASVPSLAMDYGKAVQVWNPASQSQLWSPKEPITGPVSPFSNVVSYYFKGEAKTGDKITITVFQDGVQIERYEYTVPIAYDGNTLGALENFSLTGDFVSPRPAVRYDAPTDTYWFLLIRPVGQTGLTGKNSISVLNPVGFRLIESLPIDSDVLYGYFNFGFKFAIQSGFATDPETGLIDWGSKANSLRITYDRNGELLYLNEFGFWVSQPTDINITVDQLKLRDVAQVDFNRFQNIPLPLPLVIPLDRNNSPKIYVQFNVDSGVTIEYDDIYFNVESNSDKIEAVFEETKNTAKEEYTLEISSAHSGFYLSNIMTSYFNSGLEKFFSDAYTLGATLTEMNSLSIMRTRYLPSIVFEGSIYGQDYSYFEIYEIAKFNGKKFLPLKSESNIETGVTKITLVEIRNDNIGLTVKHNGTDVE